jgi:hypothetical protein
VLASESSRLVIIDKCMFLVLPPSSKTALHNGGSVAVMYSAPAILPLLSICQIS